MVIRRVNGIVIAIVILVDGLYLLLCDVLSRLSKMRHKNGVLFQITSRAALSP